jgi:hypothetical protein
MYQHPAAAAYLTTHGQQQAAKQATKDHNNRDQAAYASNAANLAVRVIPCMNGHHALLLARN